MFNKSLLPISSLIAAALVTGCSASYDKAAEQEVTVKSVPTEATVSINGVTKDQLTDASFILDRHTDYLIEISKSGYKAATIRVDHRPTGEEAEGAPKFELDKSAIAVTLEEDAATKAARESKEAAEKAEAAKVAAAGAAVQPVETASKPAAEDAVAAKASAPAVVEAAKPASGSDGEKVARIEAELKEARNASVKDKEKIARLETEVEQAQDAPKAAEAANAAPATAGPVAVPTSLSSKPVFERYKDLRTKLATGEISSDEYKTEVAKLLGK